MSRIDGVAHYNDFAAVACRTSRPAIRIRLPSKVPFTSRLALTGNFVTKQQATVSKHSLSKIKKSVEISLRFQTTIVRRLRQEAGFPQKTLELQGSGHPRRVVQVERIDYHRAAWPAILVWSGETREPCNNLSLILRNS
ncbi:MAG: hypothetical protein U1F76_26115 [Candidatus Competibacteraceae bacterium]